MVTKILPFVTVWTSLTIATYTADPAFPWAVPAANADWRFNFTCRHQRNVEIMNNLRNTGTPVGVVFYGDSIFETMRMDGQRCPTPPPPDAPPVPRPNPVEGVSMVWLQQFSKGTNINLSVTGDRPGGLMWRLINGEGPYGITAEAAVLLIGTNSLYATNGDDYDLQNADLVAFQIASIAQLLVNSNAGLQLLVMGLLPRSNGWWVDYAWPSKFTPILARINGALQYWTPQQARMRYVDCSWLFINSGGWGLNETMIMDGLHPSGTANIHVPPHAVATVAYMDYVV